MAGFYYILFLFLWCLCVELFVLLYNYVLESSASHPFLGYDVWWVIIGIVMFTDCNIVTVLEDLVHVL